MCAKHTSETASARVWAGFAYAGTYAELTPSLRETRRREDEQKRRSRRRRRRRRTKKGNAPFHNSSHPIPQFYVVPPTHALCSTCLDRSSIRGPLRRAYANLRQPIDRRVGRWNKEAARWNVTGRSVGTKGWWNKQAARRMRGGIKKRAGK